MFDLIVVGKGPAGLSAAIYAVRAGLSVLVIGRDIGALEKAEKIENYFGFADPIKGTDLVAQGRAQAERLGVEILDAEVTGISWMDHFQVHTAQQAYEGSSLVIATGLPRKKASVAGLSAFEGRGVSYCATCDGFFYRGKTVAVIGNGEYAFKEAHELTPFAARIHLLSNGREFSHAADQAPWHEKFLPDTRPLQSVQGDEEKVRSLTFQDGSTLAVDGIFVAEGTASALDLALKLGLDNDGQVILVDRQQATNLPGVFAAGDCTGGLLQAAAAVGDGARAGMAAAAFVKESRGEKAPKVQWGE